MKNKYLTSLVCAAVCAFSSLAIADDHKEADEEGRVEIEWIEPKKFSDVRGANTGNSFFRKQVFAELEEHFEDLAEELPEGQSLKLRVTNLDLAGRVEPGSFNGFHNAGDIRIVRQIDIPRIKFEYDLIDDQGGIIKTEEVNLKDAAFLDRPRLSRFQGAQAYEKRMISRWFKDNLLNKDT